MLLNWVCVFVALVNDIFCCYGIYSSYIVYMRLVFDCVWLCLNCLTLTSGPPLAIRPWRIFGFTGTQIFKYKQSSEMFVFGFHISSPWKPGKYSYLCQREKQEEKERGRETVSERCLLINLSLQFVYWALMILFARRAFSPHARLNSDKMSRRKQKIWSRSIRPKHRNDYFCLHSHANKRNSRNFEKF